MSSSYGAIIMQELANPTLYANSSENGCGGHCDSSSNRSTADSTSERSTAVQDTLDLAARDERSAPEAESTEAELDPLIRDAECGVNQLDQLIRDLNDFDEQDDPSSPIGEGDLLEVLEIVSSELQRVNRNCITYRHMRNECRKIKKQRRQEMQRQSDINGCGCFPVFRSLSKSKVAPESPDLPQKMLHTAPAYAQVLPPADAPSVLHNLTDLECTQPEQKFTRTASAPCSHKSLSLPQIQKMRESWKGSLRSIHETPKRNQAKLQRAIIPLSQHFEGDGKSAAATRSADSSGRLSQQNTPASCASTAVYLRSTPIRLLPPVTAADVARGSRSAFSSPDNSLRAAPRRHTSPDTSARHRAQYSDELANAAVYGGFGITATQQFHL